MANLAPDAVSNETKAFDSISKDQGSLTCGVSRKINIGNFENIDVYCSVTLPVDLVRVEDMTQLKETIEVVAAEGFNMTSKETTSRYELISQLTKG